MSARTLEQWRRPELVAAVVNGALVLLVPIAFIAFMWLRPYPGNMARARVSTFWFHAADVIVQFAIVTAPFVHLQW